LTNKVIEFPKPKIGSTGNKTVAEAVEEFKFSRLPKLERIQRVLVASRSFVNGCVAEDELAAYLELQLPDDVFLKSPTKR
jgi:hypothetical protein